MSLKYLLVLLMAFAVPTAEAFSFKESWESFKAYVSAPWTWQKTAVVTGLAGITAAVLYYLKGATKACIARIASFSCRFKR